MKVLLAILGGVLAVLAIGIVTFLGFVSLAGRNFDREIAATRVRLDAQAPAGPVDVGALPPLVRDFAARADASTGCPGGTIETTQEVEMQLGEGGDWITGIAVNLAATDRPAFVWAADMEMVPLLGVRVIDSFVDGEGYLSARVGGAITVAEATGPDAALGEAMRYLGEIPWNPDAILCNGDLRWREIGDDAVEVAIDTAGGEAAVELHFDAAGDIARIAAQRPRGEKGGTVLRPWHGTFDDYGDVDGTRIPRYGDVAWEIDGVKHTYFRGRVTLARRLQPGAVSP